MSGRQLLFCVFIAAATPREAFSQFVPGDLYISAIDRVYHVDINNWSFSTFADGGDGPTEVGGVTFSPAGSLLCVNFDTDQVFAFDSAGVASVFLDASNGLSGPAAVTFDSAGNLYETNQWPHEVLLLPVGGGAGGAIADSSDGLLYPGDIIVDANGRALFADFYPLTIWSVDANGTVAAFDTLPASPMSLVLRNNGDVYVTVGFSSSGISVYRYPGGDSSQRILLCNFPKSFGWAALQIGLDDQTLYFATDEELYTIDADSGAATNVIDKSKQFFNSYAIAVYGRNFKASWSNFGTGFPGTNGIPSISPQATPVLGTTCTVDVANSYGSPTIGLLFCGLQQTFIHSGKGGDLVVAPSVVLPITFSYGSDTFCGTIPSDWSIAGMKVELQVVEADPGAAKGVSFTQGLELVFGF